MTNPITVSPAQAREMIIAGTAPDNMTVNGRLDLIGCTGLTSLPDMTVHGSLYLNGCTGLTSLPDMTVHGSLSLSGCTGLIGTKWRGRTLRVVDGYAMALGRRRMVGDIALYPAWWMRDIAPGKPLPACYVAEQSVAEEGEYTAHGDTPAEAIRDLRFKIAQADFDADELVETIRERGTVLFNDFRLITGACESGLRHGMIEAGLDPDVEELPLGTVLAKAHGEFGDTFREMFQ